jgi:hypothetical protein
MLGSRAGARGAEAVARTFSGAPERLSWRWWTAFPARCGRVGGRAHVVFGSAVAAGRVVGIDLLADTDRLGDLTLTVLED